MWPSIRRHHKLSGRCLRNGMFDGSCHEVCWEGLKKPACRTLDQGVPGEATTGQQSLGRCDTVDHSLGIIPPHKKRVLHFEPSYITLC
jgi:hypothetical protein